MLVSTGCSAVSVITSFIPDPHSDAVRTRQPPQARGEAGLLDCMESYLASSRASLVVLGSVHLTLSTAIGSVVLTLLRRLSLPMLVVTANSGE
jgi:nucleotide-binding universal stress UspA family protein